MPNETLVYPGTSSGFGRAPPTREVSDRLVSTLRNEDRLKEFATQVVARSFSAILDVTDSERIQPMIDRGERMIGPIDMVFNKAGHGHEGTFEEFTIEDL